MIGAARSGVAFDDDWRGNLSNASWAAPQFWHGLDHGAGDRVIEDVRLIEAVQVMLNVCIVVAHIIVCVAVIAAILSVVIVAVVAAIAIAVALVSVRMSKDILFGSHSDLRFDNSFAVTMCETTDGASWTMSSFPVQTQRLRSHHMLITA